MVTSAEPTTTPPTPTRDTLAGSGSSASTASISAAQYMSMTQVARPPEFLKDKAQFKSYKRNLLRWDRLTNVEPKNRGDLVLLNIPESNKLKEMLEQEVGDQVQDNPDGVKLIIEALESLYGENEVLEGYLRFRDLEEKQRTVGQCVLEYVSEWETLYGYAKEHNIELEDRVKGFKLLMTCNLEDLDLKLVIAELDFKTVEGKKNVFAQVKAALRKHKAAGM